MDVDRDSPIIASARREIAVAPASIWRILADIEGWPRWNPDVKSATADGPLTPGTTFRWKAGPGTITSVLRQVEEPRELGWTGKTFGIRAVHVYRLEPAAGGTLVTTEESWDGLLARLLSGMMRNSLQGSLEAGLEHLQREAERPQPPGA